MTHLELRLLGPPQILLDGTHVSDLTSRKALALFYYLCATGRSHSRQALAGLLWSELPEARARRNLRGELHRLRHDYALADAFLIIQRAAVAFNRQSRYTLDVAQFEACAADANPPVEQMQHALSLYRGEFLADFAVFDAPQYEEWMRWERERLCAMALRLSHELVGRLLEQQQFENALATVDWLLALDRMNEQGYQQKMRLLALTGQRTQALELYEACADLLYQELGVDVSPETQALYDDILAGTIGPREPDALATAPVNVPPPFQAPPQPLHFVGRTRESDQICEWLTTAEAPICALVGMGGVGKTTLAARIAHQLRDQFPDGVLWAAIGAGDPLDILVHWARAYGYDFSTIGAVENRAAALRGALADKRVLFVLDDVRSAARVRALLPAGAHCATLLTTRDRDVAVACNALVCPVHELAPTDSRALLVQILGAARVDAEPAAADEICTLLQNLPLAVEITAQRLAFRTHRRLADIAARLRSVQHRLDLVVSDLAVRASFTVSWESLGVRLKRIFALLGVFEGRAFGAAALAHVADLDLYTAEDRLFDLAALSLVTVREDGEQERYQQHSLLADFAREKLAGDVEAHAAMADYYRHFAETHQTDYLALQPEWDNMMAGMHTAHRQQDWSLVLAYADALAEAWFVRARFSEARRACQMACRAAVALQNAAAHATWLRRWGCACLEQNEYEEAETLLQRSLQIYRAEDDQAGVATVQYERARIALERAQYAEAQRLLAESRRIRETLNDRAGVAATLYREARIFSQLGADQDAEAFGMRALALQEASDDQRGMLPTLRLLAWLATFRTQEYARARTYCERALDLCTKLHDQGELAATLHDLAAVCRRQGELETAQRHAERSLELFRRMGDRKFQGLTLYWLSVIQEDQAAYASAMELGAQSLQLLREVNDTFDLVFILLHMGDLYLHTDQPQRAHAVWQEAVKLAETHNHPSTTKLYDRLATLAQPC